MDADVARYLAEIVAAARSVLGADLTGAYAAGSIALDAYQPDRSDVDVALVCRHRLDAGAKRALVSRLRHEARPGPARGLELVVYRQDVAAAGTPDPGFEVELNSGPRMPFRATYDPADRPAADGRFWYALDRSILHQSGVALLGRPAGDVFADVSPGDLRRLLADALEWWLRVPMPAGDEPAPGAEDAVLGACRSLVKLRRGVWLDKEGAGRHLLHAGCRSRLIERSIAARHGGRPPTAREARAFQRRVLDEINDDSRHAGETYGAPDYLNG